MFYCLNNMLNLYGENRGYALCGVVDICMLVFLIARLMISHWSSNKTILGI